ncbi:peptidoglycan DD-metalloendopeptidase family protein [Nocardia aurea]|uniref:peptidoglycan DD-metalloendopeptidase family protein n=1 Tax=Nocardia aurea TaxID=2144174 RepID=UPI0033A8AB1E
MTARYWPLKRGFIITSPFGPRPGGFHTGTDFGWFGGSAGLPVYAIQSGTVIYAGAADGYGGPAPAGWLVIDSIDAEGSGCLEYGHIISEVQPGQHVTAGQRIGRINPDEATNGGVSPHLHVSSMPREYNPGTKQDVIPRLRNALYPDEKPTPSKPKTGGAMREIDWTSAGVNSSSRYGSAVRLWVQHTQEGNGTAESLARYLQNPSSGVSYHYTGDDASNTIVAVVDTDRASWSVLDANPYTINFCYAGSRADMSRQEWLDKFGRTIDYAAFLFVQDAIKYNPLAPQVIDYADVRRGRSGATDHKGITVGLGIGDHTDVGPNYPWDVFMAAVERHAKGTNITVVVNAIDEQAKVTPWLGTRITQGENTCPDGRGRWAQFEHGYIYWTPTTGARPIPTNIFETWAELEYETGPLGYPVNYHTVLPVEGEPKVGDVQAFEGGVIYRRYGQPGYWVHGAIGERWKRDGFESSLWGWPISNETKFPGGAYQDFERGRITWSEDNTLGLKPTDGPDEIVPATTH